MAAMEKLVIHPRGRYPQHPYHVEDFVKMYNAGHSMAEVAHHFGVSPSTVWRQLHKIAGEQSAQSND